VLAPVSVDAIRDISDNPVFGPEVQQLEIILMNSIKRFAEEGEEEFDVTLWNRKCPIPWEVYHKQRLDLLILTQALQGLPNLTTLALVN
jgi:hypothetical protein